MCSLVPDVERGRGRASEKFRLCKDENELVVGWASLRVGNFISTSAVFSPLCPLVHPPSLRTLYIGPSGRVTSPIVGVCPESGKKISANASSKFHLTRQLARSLARPISPLAPLGAKNGKLHLFVEWSTSSSSPPPPQCASAPSGRVVAGLAFHLSAVPLSAQGIYLAAPLHWAEYMWGSAGCPLVATGWLPSMKRQSKL